MKIQILGTGCHNCLELERRLAEAVAKSGQTDVEVERLDNEPSAITSLWTPFPAC
jgi:hypothetical protein